MTHLIRAETPSVSALLTGVNCYSARAWLNRFDPCEPVPPFLSPSYDTRGRVFGLPRRVRTPGARLALLKRIISSFETR